MTDIVVIGSNMVDLISYIDRMPVEGETIEAPDFALGCGGKGANQAVAAARLGSDVLMVTRVGDDIFGPNTLRNFEANGIDTRHVKVTPGTSGVAPIFVDPESKNSIIIVKGANAALSPADVEAAAEDAAGAKLIVMQLEVPLETIYAGISLGERLGVPVLLNPAPANASLDFDQAARCAFFAPNETELATLTGLPTGSVDEVRVAAGKLLERGCRNVIVTMGSRGVMWMSDEGAEVVLDPFPVDAVDTTGAGDAFIGCFSHLVAGGRPVDKALRVANVYAANSVTKRGTQTSYADAAGFEAWCRERGVEVG